MKAVDNPASKDPSSIPPKPVPRTRSLISRCLKDVQENNPDLNTARQTVKEKQLIDPRTMQSPRISVEAGSEPTDTDVMAYRACLNTQRKLAQERRLTEEEAKAKDAEETERL